MEGWSWRSRRAPPGSAGTAPAPSLRESVVTHFISEARLAAFLSVSIRTLQSWRRSQKGPPYYNAGRRVIYDPTEVEAWVRVRHPELAAPSD